MLISRCLLPIHTKRIIAKSANVANIESDDSDQIDAISGIDANQIDNHVDSNDGIMDSVVNDIPINVQSPVGNSDGAADIDHMPVDSDEVIIDQID